MGALEGRIALVTGASRGIGEAIARRFAAEGATVVAVSRTRGAADSRLPGSVDETVRAIEAGGGRAAGFVCDVSDPASRDALVDHVLERFGRVDVLVNNAAFASYGWSWSALTPARWERLLQLNLLGPFHLAQRLLPGMLERGRGWILNITSRTAETPAGPPFSEFDRSSGVMLYGTSKAALNRMTVGLAAEMQGRGVAVNALAPFSVVWTAGAAAVGTARYRSSPGWKEEPVEAMAEAALALCSGDPGRENGRLVYSTEFLEQIGRATRTLDGRHALEGWKPQLD
jgi:NAD(P)-dependent dehydrogenase (short-subunit alcohol dehydrogenase family)